jgi:hypothetical protein
VGKALAITEFGCTTHQGAAARGGHGGLIVEWDTPTHTAFWCTFASYHLPHHSDPSQDLDMASYGVVKVLQDHPGHTYPGMPWEPKAAFAAMADAYQEG